jgi:hypothetical protein
VELDYHVSIKVDKSRGITLEGYTDDLMEAKEAIYHILLEVTQQEYEKRENQLLAEKVKGFTVTLSC